MHEFIAEAQAPGGGGGAGSVGGGGGHGHGVTHHQSQSGELLGQRVALGGGAVLTAVLALVAWGSDLPSAVFGSGAVGWVSGVLFGVCLQRGSASTGGAAAVTAGAAFGCITMLAVHHGGLAAWAFVLCWLAGAVRKPRHRTILAMHVHMLAPLPEPCLQC